MKTEHPQISQITQILGQERVCEVARGYQTDAFQPYSYNLCNLRNLRIVSMVKS